MTLSASVRGWVRFGFCPIQLVSRDWGCPGCRRLVLVATACGHGDQELFLGEFDNSRELEKSRRAYLGVITRVWNKATGATS